MESCRWCGASISPRDAVCSDCGSRLRRESATCPRCGQQIRSGLVVCPHCGEELRGRRVPWKLLGSLAGLALAAVVVYLVLTMVTLPFDLPFVAAAPTATPTEVILPPTPTWTATPRPPTATPTATATLTPVVTATVTVSATATFSPTQTLSPVETATVTPTPNPTPTESPGYAYQAPRIVGPVDESDLPEGQFNFTYGSIIRLTWEPVGTLAEEQWYSVSVTYEARDGQTREQVNWVKQTSWEVPREWYDEVGDDRSVYWSVTVVSGTPGTDESLPLSPPSETRMFRWG